jgi:hypothetical protein
MTLAGKAAQLPFPSDAPETLFATSKHAAYDVRRNILEK